MADQEFHDEVHRHLYGTPDGVYVIVEHRGGPLPPPEIPVSHPRGRVVSLPYLGRTFDVVRVLDEQLRDRFAAADIQEYIASLLGCSQQSVSRYVQRGTEPRLRPDGWTALVRAYYQFKPAEVRLRG